MHILMIEDEDIWAEKAREAVSAEPGWTLERVTSGGEALARGGTVAIDVLVVDRLIETDGADGLQLLARLREMGVTAPALVLSSLGQARQRVEGLDAGADDYLAKPFQSEELIARLRALIRRASGNASSELTAGDVRLDTRSGKVTLSGDPVKLTAQEYKLLSYLLHHKGKVVSRTELIEHIYDQDFDRDSNTIEVFVPRIRKKLGADVITTIRGLGYSLDEPGR